MITKLLIVDTEATTELVESVEKLKADDVSVITFDLSGGFIEEGTGKNLFVENVMTTIREISEMETINLTNIGFVYSKQDLTSKSSDGYINSSHIIQEIQQNMDNLSSWDYLVSTADQLHLVTLIESFDLIDINHFLYSEYYSTIFDYINSNIRQVADDGFRVNYLQPAFKQDIVRDELYHTNNWLYSMCTTFYSGSVESLMDKYFNPTGSLLDEVETITLTADIDIRYVVNETNADDTVITNVILFDLHLSQYLEEVQNTLLSNTIIITFSKRNSYNDIKNALKFLQSDENVEMNDVALFQNNSQQPIYNVVSEETSIIVNTITEDPSLNTWSMFTDFVLYLEEELNIQHFDLFMCKIYSDENWKYVIENVSDKLNSLEIRSSEDVTGHVIFDGDWILESPVVDVNLIGLYFDESIASVEVHLDAPHVITSKADLVSAVNAWIDGTWADADGDINTWDTGNVTNMSNIFYGKTTFNDDIGNWNVSNVTEMTHMFYNCKVFNQDLSGWDVANVTNMYQMFYGAKLFNTSINNWDVGNVLRLDWMFYAGGNDGYNQPLNNWNTSKVTNFRFMFANTRFNQDISGWDVANATKLDAMFKWNSAFNQDLNPWQVKSQANLNEMFYSATSFSQILSGSAWMNHTGTQTDTFTNSNNSYILIDLSLDADGRISQIDLEKAIRNWNSQQSDIISQIGHISTWDTTNITSLQNLFKSNQTFNENISSWNVSNVTNMKDTFYNARTFNQDLSGWNVSNVTTMNGMFTNAKAFNQNINTWDVGNVTDFYWLFGGATVFDQPLDNWNVSKGTQFRFMFYVNSYNQDITGWNVSNAMYMDGMFKNNSVFNQDISNWDVGNARDMYEMFYGATAFNQDIGSWNVKNATRMYNMFQNATSFNQDLSLWPINPTNNLKNMFDGATSFDQVLNGFFWVNHTGIQTNIFENSNGSIATDSSSVAIPFLLDNVVYEEKPLASGDNGSYEEIVGKLNDSGVIGYYAKGNVLYGETATNNFEPGLIFSDNVFNFGENDFTVECFVYPTKDSNGNYTSIINYGSMGVNGTHAVFEINYMWDSYALPDNSQRNSISVSLSHGISGTGAEYNHDNTGSGPTGTLAMNADHVIANQQGSAVIVPNTTYHHVCVSRKGNTFTAFLNGSIIYQETKDWDPPVVYGAGLGMKFSQYKPSDQRYFNGNIQDVKIINGVGRDEEFTITTGLDNGGFLSSGALEGIARPEITISSSDISSGDISTLGKHSFSIGVSSNALNIIESDLSFTHGVVSNFNKVSNSSYTFDFTSDILGSSLPCSVYLTEDSITNSQARTNYNEASNIFEWFWRYTLTPPDVVVSSSDISNGDSHTSQFINMEMKIMNDLLENNTVTSTFSELDVSAVNGYVYDLSFISISPDAPDISNIVVTVDTKTSNHPYYDNGSSSGYYMDTNPITDYSDILTSDTWKIKENNYTDDVATSISGGLEISYNFFDDSNVTESAIFEPGNMYTVYIIGGGGGGGGGIPDATQTETGNNWVGSGGGGGAMIKIDQIMVNSPSSATINVGSGGDRGLSGEDTTFTLNEITYTAGGGGAGIAGLAARSEVDGVPSSNFAGGVGGVASYSGGDINSITLGTGGDGGAAVAEGNWEGAALSYQGEGSYVTPNLIKSDYEDAKGKSGINGGAGGGGAGSGNWAGGHGGNGNSDYFTGGGGGGGPDGRIHAEHTGLGRTHRGDGGTGYYNGGSSSNTHWCNVNGGDAVNDAEDGGGPSGGVAGVESSQLSWFIDGVQVVLNRTCFAGGGGSYGGGGGGCGDMRGVHVLAAGGGGGGAVIIYRMPLPITSVTVEPPIVPNIVHNGHGGEEVAGPTFGFLNFEKWDEITRDGTSNHLSFETPNRTTHMLPLLYVQTTNHTHLDKLYKFTYFCDLTVPWLDNLGNECQGAQLSAVYVDPTGTAPAPSGSIVNAISRRGIVFQKNKDISGNLYLDRNAELEGYVAERESFILQQRGTGGKGSPDRTYWYTNAASSTYEKLEIFIKFSKDIFTIFTKTLSDTGDDLYISFDYEYNYTAGTPMSINYMWYYWGRENGGYQRFQLTTPHQMYYEEISDDVVVSDFIAIAASAVSAPDFENVNFTSNGDNTFNIDLIKTGSGGYTNNTVSDVFTTNGDGSIEVIDGDYRWKYPASSSLPDSLLWWSNSHNSGGDLSDNHFILTRDYVRESPDLTFVVGSIYIFDQSDSTNIGHPLLFYEDENKGVQYTTNVTTTGSAGSAGASVSIEITGSTPTTLYYQCGNHAFMGGEATTISSGSPNISSIITFKLGTTSSDGFTSLTIPRNILSRTFNGVHVVKSNNSSNMFQWSYSSPDLTISSLVVNTANGTTVNSGGSINTNTIWIQFTFSESVYSIDNTYFIKSNCKITNVSVDSTFTVYTIRLQTFHTATASVSLKTDKLITCGRGIEKYITETGNTLSFNWNYDDTRPQISMTSSQTSGLTNNASFVDLSFVTTLPTADFTINSITVTGSASLSNFVPISTTEYSVRLTPSSASSINLTVNASAFTDSVFGNSSENAISFHWEYDNVPPTVTITSPTIVDGETSSDPYINLSFAMSKPVADFVLSDDLNVVNGILGTLTRITDSLYTAKVYPTQNDRITVTVLSNSITDAAGNKNVYDSNVFEWLFTSNELLVSLASNEITNGASFTSNAITMTLTTSDTIVDFVEHDIVCTNGTITDVDSASQTFTVTSDSANTETTVKIAAGSVVTSLGVGNIESNLFTWTYSPPIPRLSIESTQVSEGGITNISPVDFTLTFDNSSVVFDQTNLNVSNGTVSTFSGSGANYQVGVTPSGSQCVIALGMSENQAYVVDNGNHYNDVSYNFEWTYDSVVPSFTIDSDFVALDASTSLTNINLNITSTKTVSGLSINDFDITNGVISTLSDSSGTSFTATVQPFDNTIDCTISVNLNAGSVVDTANNVNAETNIFSFDYVFVSRKLETSALVTLFEEDSDIPEGDRLSPEEITMFVASAASLTDHTSPFEASSSGDSETAFVKPPKITIPASVSVVNPKVFTRLVDQIFASASESVTSLTIDKSSMAIASAAEDELADVEEIVMLKSNQTAPVDMSSLIEDPTQPSATYIPLANVGDFAIVTIDGVDYTTIVNSDSTFTLSSNTDGTIGTYNSNDVYTVNRYNKIIFGSQIISTSPVLASPTLTITSGDVEYGVSYATSIDLSFVFSSTVEIDLTSIEPLNNTTIVSTTIETIDSGNTYIAVSVAPTDDTISGTIGVIVDENTFYDTEGTYNDVSFSYSWYYGTGAVSVPSYIPCFLKGTQILTTKGYKNVEFLDPKKDKLLDKDNNPLKFLDLQKYSQDNNGKQYPYKIPGGSVLSEDYTCTRDLYLTYNHCVYLPHLDSFAPVSFMRHMKEDKTLTQNKFTYYHVFTENYFSDTLMANGIPCESHSKFTFAKLRNIDPTGTLLNSMIKKANMLPNCMRNRLTTKECKQVIKKYKSNHKKKRNIRRKLNF